MTSVPEKVNVNLIDAFTGPTHEKLKLLWQHFARQNSDRMTLHVFDNTRLQLPHDRALERMWELESRRTESKAIFTEFDLLPGLDLLDAAPTRGTLACEYCTRDPESKQLRFHGMPGAWLLLFDKDSAGQPRFESGGPFNDPCNLLEAQLLGGLDCYPRHYGVGLTSGELRLGEHLFWSRHYNDDPDTYPAGFHLRPILEGVDRAIKSWISRQ